MSTEAVGNLKRGREEKEDEPGPPEAKRPNLFGAIIAAQKEKQAEKANEGTSLFRDTNGKCLIFDEPNDDGSNKKDAKDITNNEGKSLFGNGGPSLFSNSSAFSTTGGSSLFGSTVITTGKSLFNTSPPVTGSSLFDSKPTEGTGTSLFDSKPTEGTGTSIFDSKSVGGLFGTSETSLFQAKPAGDEEAGGGGAEDETVADGDNNVVIDVPKNESGFEVLHYDKSVRLFQKVGDSFVNKGPGAVKILVPENSEDEQKIIIFRSKGSGNIVLSSSLENVVMGEESVEMSKGMKGIRFAAPSPKEETKVGKETTTAKDDPVTERLDNKLDFFIIKFKEDESRVTILNYIKNRDDVKQ